MLKVLIGIALILSGSCTPVFAKSRFRSRSLTTRPSYSGRRTTSSYRSNAFTTPGRERFQKSLPYSSRSTPTGKWIQTEPVRSRWLPIRSNYARFSGYNQPSISLMSSGSWLNWFLLYSLFTHNHSSTAETSVSDVKFGQIARSKTLISSRKNQAPPRLTICRPSLDPPSVC